MQHPPLEDFFQTLALYDTLGKIVVATMIVAAIGVIAYIIFD